MKIELKNIRRAAFASQETECFEASVWIDGKHAGMVENQGQGGCNFYRPPALGDQIDAYARTLPKRPVDLGGGSIEELDMDADLLIGDLLDRHIIVQQLKRTMKVKLIYRLAEDGKLYESKRRLTPAELASRLEMPKEALRHRLGASVVLNHLTLDEAVEEYRREPAPVAAAAA